jgi:hypothetical protein
MESVERVGLEQLALIVLALAAVLAVLVNLSGAFWTGWLVLATVCPLAAKCRRFAPAVGT